MPLRDRLQLLDTRATSLAEQLQFAARQDGACARKAFGGGVALLSSSLPVSQ